MIRGTTKGASTDFDGMFLLEAKPKDIINVSYVGYKTLEIDISKDNYFIVTLIPDNSLEEVVVSALRIKEEEIK